MSKDLEREYRALVNSEAPDLWARIEAGLEEKKTADLYSVSNSVSNSISIEKNQKKRVDFKLWAGLAAACACVALIVPAMARTMIMGGSGGSQSNSAPSNYSPAQYETYDRADSAGQKAGTEYENGMYNGAASDDAGINNMTTSEGMNTASDSAHIDNAVALEEAVEATAEEAYSFHATVEILDIDDYKDNGILYTAKVIASGESELQVDSEVRIFRPVLAAEGVTALEDSHVYELVLYEDHSGSFGQEMTYILEGVVEE